VDPGRHRLGTVVKAATYHQLTIRQADGGWEIKVILDI
jgi:SHS2 domain-containing protein